MLLTVLIVVVAVVILYFIYTYNGLIRLNNLSQEGWSGIDVQLKRRSDLIPNLVESVKGYMGHESGVLEEVTKLRAQCASSTTVPERANNENMLSGALRQLFAVSESYPDLKASQNFLELQTTLATVEDQIQLARRYYNGTVRDFNILVQSFPSNLVAKKLNFVTKDFFEITDPAERTAPAVKFL
jgi:LemA protein